MKNSLSVKAIISLESIGFYLCVTGLFILPYIVRQQLIIPFSNRTFYWGINFIALLGLALLIISNLLYHKKIYKWYFLPMFSFMLTLPTQFVHPISFGGLIMFSCCCIFSQFILFITLSPESVSKLLKTFVFIFNIIILFLCITAIIDKLSDRSFVKYLSTIFTYDTGFLTFSNENGREYMRFFSIFGHPLVNSLLFNGFLMINLFYARYQRNIFLSAISCIIAIIGNICTGSRLGLVICIIYMCIIYYKKWQLYVACVFGFIVLYLSGIMDNIITRFQSASFSNGRFEAITKMFLRVPHNTFRPFIGIGNLKEEFASMLRSLDINATAATEIPLIDLGIQYGFVFSCVVLFTPLVYVTYILIRKRRYMEYIFWLFLYIQVNSFNGIACHLDIAFIFYFLTFIFLNLCNAKKLSTK